MDTPGYIALSRLTAQGRATAVLANNMANLDTPGFRAERPVFAPALRGDRAAAITPGGRPVSYSWDRATWRDTQGGPIQVTGNPLDAAIQGEGYFAVETPRGERYTRAGRFTLDGDRRVVDPDGNPVLNTEGQPIALAAGDTRIEILGDGTLRSQNGAVARLRLMSFSRPQDLLPEGDRLFAPAAGQAGQPVDRPRIVGGAVEGSNVLAVAELTRLTAEVREFQNVATFAEREGERLGSAVDRILRRRG